MEKIDSKVTAQVSSTDRLSTKPAHISTGYTQRASDGVVGSNSFSIPYPAPTILSSTNDKIISELDSKIPATAVRERSGGNGMRLSYLEGHYVIDRLNKLFGQGNWSHQVRELKTCHVSTEPDDKGRFHCSYYAVIALELKFPDGTEAVFSDVGYGEGMDRLPTKCHELAVKEAVTDGIKRCAKSLGMSMGLALYSKDQENVEDVREPKETVIESKQQAGRQDTSNAREEPKKASAASRNTKDEKERLIELTAAQGHALMKIKGYTLDSVKEIIQNKYNKARIELNLPELHELSEHFRLLLDKPAVIKESNTNANK